MWNITGISSISFFRRQYFIAYVIIKLKRSCCSSSLNSPLTLNSEIRFCTGTSSTCCMSEICDGESLTMVLAVNKAKHILLKFDSSSCNANLKNKICQIWVIIAKCPLSLSLSESKIKVLFMSSYSVLIIGSWLFILVCIKYSNSLSFHS